MKRILMIATLFVTVAFALLWNGISLSSSVEERNDPLSNETQTQEENTSNNLDEAPLEIPFYKKQITMNYSVGVEIVPQYIVIHETSNTSVGADADAHYRYWNSNQDANASTHFVVDSTKIYQMLELNQKAWHVGDNRGYSNITNDNSIGIEIAVNADGNYAVARQYTIELTIRTMKQLNMNITQLKRHYDASGKNCPAIMLANPSLWTDFVNQVEAGLQI